MEANVSFLLIELTNVKANLSPSNKQIFFKFINGLSVCGFNFYYNFVLIKQIGIMVQSRITVESKLIMIIWIGLWCTF